MATGLVFAKFCAQRFLIFSAGPPSPMNGVPTLSFRLSNRRVNSIAEARVRVVLVRTETTAEGKVFYRNYDLRLERDRILSLARSWSVLHHIDESSPLFGETPESLQAEEAELTIGVSGTDDLWMQTVHGRHRDFSQDIVWGARPADICLTRAT
jgi:inward rectifier potassium channel